jgi:hypothetical protein
MQCESFLRVQQRPNLRFFSLPIYLHPTVSRQYLRQIANEINAEHDRPFLFVRREGT